MLLVITQCSMRHLYDSQPKDETLITHAKEFERRRCGHHELEKPLSTLECIKSCVDPKENRTNKNHYVVASQDEELRRTLRSIPGVPLLYIKRSVMIMEPMAGASTNIKDKEEKAKFRAGLTAARGAKRLRGADDDEDHDGEGEAMMRAVRNLVGGTEGQKEDETGDATEPAKKKRKRGPSGPNPMSVKKKKKDTSQSVAKKPKAVAPAGATEAPIQAESTDSKRAEDNAQLQPDGTAKPKRKRKHKSGAATGIAPATQEEIAT